LKDEQGNTESSVEAAKRGDAPPARKRKWRNMERRLIRLKQEYRNGVMSMEEYWDAVCHWMVSY
jgi:DNA-binding ferritin-like protein (Dps family)